MNSSTTREPSTTLTARDVLCENPDGLTAEVERGLGEEELRQAMSPGTAGVASTFLLAQAATAIDSILGALEVEQLLMGGWMQLAELQAAIDETASDQTSRHVALTSHTVGSEHHPSLEMVINQTPTKLIDLGLNLGFTLAACELVVENGRITGVELGSVTAHGHLTAADRTILERESSRIDPKRLFKSVSSQR